MRGWRLLAALLLVTTGLTGCIGSTIEDLGSTAADDGPLNAADVEAPEGASVQEIEEGIRFVFEDVELPLEREIEIPNGTKMVRVTADRAGSGAIYPILSNAESEALRCIPRLRSAWNAGVTANTTCAGLTAIDGDAPTWKLNVFASVDYDYLVQAGPIGLIGEPTRGTAEIVQVDLVDEVSGGPTEDLALDRLSQAHHEIGETEIHEVESHDGAKLHVEVTTPEGGHGSYPTLLISSPYTYGDRASGERAYDSTVRDWVPRGYTVVVADVRGFAKSGGCVEVWGPNEQKDQAVLVEWITEQGFSDGHVGMYGVSYPGTTPVEAAVQAPEGLDAIATTAGVIDAYRDWHFGGVPNGESIGSPMAYQRLGMLTSTAPTDPASFAMESGNGVCDATLAARANDPRAIYDEYYQVRNLSQRADEIEAATLVQHAYEDPNVKSSMQLGFFNAIDAPKLGLFGHWSHQPAARADEPTLRLAWMDQFVKGQEIGLANVSKASITANGDRYREADAWPSQDTSDQPLYPHFQTGELVAEPGDGSDTLVLTGASQLEPAGRVTGALATDTMIPLEVTLLRPLALGGPGRIQLDVTLQGADNAYVAAYLYDATDEDDPKLVTYGWTNLAHRGTHDSYDPVAPGERVEAPIPLLPTEYTFEAGDTMRLELRGVTEDSWGREKPGKPGQLVVHAGEDGTVMTLPRVGADSYRPIPTSLAPSMFGG